MQCEAQKVEISELEPGTVIHLSPEQLREMSLKYKQPEGVSEAVFMGSHTSYLQGMTSLNLAWMKGNQLIDGVSPYTNLGTKSKIELATGKPCEQARDLFMKKYKKTFPSPLSRGMTIGGDPEIFVVDGKGEVIPAWEFLPGKDKSRTYYWDGLQAEWQATVCTCLVEYNNSLQNDILYLTTLSREKNRKAKLSLRNVIEVPQDILQNAEQKYLEFGCSPSINVYDDAGEPPPDPRGLPIRFAGGHIHAGIGKSAYTPQIRHAVYALDGLLGVACVGMAEKFDDPARRRYYGRAGEIRLPTHGLEYRVLSNFWLISPAISYLVHEIFRQALKFGMTGAYSMLFKTPQDEVRRIINECDVKAARACVKKNEDMFRHIAMFMNFGEHVRTHKWMLKAIYGGVQSVLPELDINVNWSNANLKQMMMKHVYPSFDYTGRAGDLTWNAMSLMLEKKNVQPVGE